MRSVLGPFNGLFPQIYDASAVSIDSDPSKCLVDVLVIFFNIIINNPQRSPLLIGQFLTDKDRFVIFLRSYLDHIDSLTNSRLSAHLNESELEFTAIIVGILNLFRNYQAFRIRRCLWNSFSFGHISSSDFPTGQSRRSSKARNADEAAKANRSWEMVKICWSSNLVNNLFIYTME